MRRLLANIALSLLGVWFALYDHCLIVAADRPISRAIIMLLVLQASIGAVVVLMVNRVFPTLAEMATDGVSIRTKLIVFAIPSILFLITPAIISDAMYREVYGNIDKFVVHAHVGHDLRCCLNPLVHWLQRAPVRPG